ncbi:MAG: rhodanese-like domain-containing protein [Nitriliruptoraceae bacterium]
MRRVAALVAAIVPFLLLASRDSQTPGVRRVSVEDIAATLEHDSPVLLDVRTQEEVAQARLADTVVNIDFYAPGFTSDIAALDRDQTYVLYCRSGQRTSHVTTLMTDLGFTDVRELAGGLIRWVDAGKPLSA